MRKNTKMRKMTSQNLKNLQGENWIEDRMLQVFAQGKQGFDILMQDMGRMVAESILYIEREEIAGPDYRPIDPGIQKWASEGGSVFIGDQKVRLERPRLRGPEGEISLASYEAMSKRGAFSEELLSKVLRGISTQKYAETVTNAAHAVGVSPSSISRHIVEATGKKLKEFKERDLSGFRPFAVFIDTIHRGGEAFMVALGIDLAGNKLALGFWEGATENHDLCEALMVDLERRGLTLSKRIIWVTDGGSGIIKALKERFGKKLIHVRCMIHKSRNIQRQLAKKYRKAAHKKLKTALEQEKYLDAKGMLEEMEKWLRKINESAADSLLEAFEELLTLHRLKVPALLRKALWTTNPIESMFSTVRSCERNVKRYRTSKMAQRWLASVLLHCEKGFRRVKGFADIPSVVERIEAIQVGNQNERLAA